jgi:RNA recognition motif-containing protein
MGSKLYVGGLPYSTTQAELTDLFSAHGTVQSANVISDKYTGQSRGFGFIEMSSGEEAQAAITALHSTELGGRTLTVNEAKPMAPRSGGGGFGGDRGDDRGGRKSRF